MGRKISPLFAAIVIAVVLGIAVIWFMTSYRAYEARQAEIGRQLQAQRDMAMRSGRYMRGLRGMRGQTAESGERGQTRRAPGQRGR